MSSAWVSTIQDQEDHGDAVYQLVERFAENPNNPVTSELGGVIVMIDMAKVAIGEAVKLLVDIHANREAIPTVQRFRSRVFSEGIMYRNNVFPGAGVLVQSVQRFFEFYKDFEFKHLEGILTAMKGESIFASESAKKVEYSHEFVVKRLVLLADEIIALLGSLEIQVQEEKSSAVESMGLLKRAKSTVRTLYSLVEKGVMGIEGPDAIEWSSEKQDFVQDLFVAAKKLAPLLDALTHLLTGVKGMTMLVEKIGREMSKLGQFDLPNKSLHWRKMEKNARMICDVCDNFLTARIDIDSELVRIKATASKKYQEEWMNSFVLHGLSELDPGDRFVGKWLNETRPGTEFAG